MKLIAALLILIAGGAGLPLGSGWLHPAAATLLPQSRAVVAVTPEVIPPQAVGQEPLSLSGAGYAVDAATMTPLYDAGAGRQLPIASLTKLMTTLVALHDLQPDQVVAIGQLPAYDPEDETIGLVKGEKLTVNSLLQATVIQSADDAADALAIADAGSLPKFIAKMNSAAKTYGLRHTHFASASGLTDENNYSSPHDLAIIAKIFISSPTLSRLASTSQAAIHDAAGRGFGLTTTDDLLANGQFSGIKTGYTLAAGQCFVGLTTIAGHQVITVVLHSGDRFGDTQALRGWIERNWQWPPQTKTVTQ